jgi:NAD(P)H-quinone oxidoreductase subunit 6
MMIGLGDLLFYLVAGFTVLAAAGVAFSNNIVYSAFALMGAFMGAAGLYVFLAADFVAIVQVLVYVGGILVLTLFAVMLTHRIDDVQISNRSVGRLPALLILGAIGTVMMQAIFRAGWHVQPVSEPMPTTAAIGNAFLTDYVLPFELASIVLLAALLGAVLLSRKELRAS